MQFISMHSFGDSVVDRRMIQIEFEFFSASQQQVCDLARYYFSAIQALLEQSFSILWYLNGRRIKEAHLQSSLENGKKIRDIYWGGNVSNSAFNSAKTILKYNKALKRKLTFSGRDIDYSIDYWDVYNELFRNVSKPDEVRQQLLKLFKMENRYHKQVWFGEDVCGTFHTVSYWDCKDLFHGTVDFRIALKCLGNDAEAFAQKAKNFLAGVIQIIPEVSGRVALSPQKPPAQSCSYHTEYFGGWIRNCPAGKKPFMRDHEWTDEYYLKGTEWYNLLTPLQASLIRNRKHPQGIAVTELENGGCIAYVQKDILSTGVADLCNLKRLLYPVLYPGKCEIPLYALLDPNIPGYLVKPRREWENIPILNEEVIALDDRIVLTWTDAVQEY